MKENISTKKSLIDESGQDDRLLDYLELCAYLKISSSTLRQWVAQGRIPHLKLANGKLVRFSFMQIKSWLSQSIKEGAWTKN